jgi:phenylalanyl-tRNA synthetase beta chain
MVVPSWRADILRMADIAEEVARMYGYDNIPTTMLSGEITQGRLTPEQKFALELSEGCRAAGCYEVQTLFLYKPEAVRQNPAAEDSGLRISTRITNPLSEDMSVMRTTPPLDP